MISIKKLALSVIASLLFALSWAQDKKIDVDWNVNKGDNSTWYMQPWVWVVGGAIFLLILVGLLKGNQQKG